MPSSATGAPLPVDRVAELARSQPGRSTDAPAEAPGRARLVMLASNESPFGPLPGVVAAAAAALGRSNRYPDHTAAVVAEAFATHVGVSTDRVAVGPGAVGLLQQIALAFVDAGAEVVSPWPSFIAYPHVIRLAGGTHRAVPLRRGRPDVEAIAAQITDRTRLVVLANPDNPTSCALTTEELTVVIDAAPSGCLVVVDEAYREFVTSPGVPDALDAFGGRPNVAVLRSMSKAYGLAGLRVGFLVAEPTVVEAVKACATPYAVSSPAQAAAVVALRQSSEVRRRCAVIAGERDRIGRTLRQWGVGLPVSSGNFWWLPAGDRAAALADALEHRGVVTRVLEGGIRVTVGSARENERFLDALAAALGDDPASSPLLSDWGVATGRSAALASRWLERLDGAMSRLRAHIGREHPGRTAPVPGEHETWDDRQVWAHVAEFGGYWLDQLEAVLDARSPDPVPFGRTRRDASRVAAVETGRHVPPDRHLATVESAAERLSAMLSGMTDEDWARTGRHETLGVMHVDAQLEHFHVGHYEEHADQLDGIC